MRPLVDYGLWEIDRIEVSVPFKNLAVISYSKYEKNANTYLKRVKLTWRDKMKGLSLKEKTEREITALKSKLEKENKKIRELKHIEDSLNCKS